MTILCTCRLRVGILFAGALSFLMVGCGCSGDPEGSTPSTQGRYRGYLAHTLLFGQNDNAEVVKIVPGQARALVVCSKSQKVSLLAVQGEQLVELRSRQLVSEGTGESELTHVDVSPQGQWAVATRTIVDRDSQGRTISCRGELLFFDSRDGPTFGQILSRVTVGPMPDSVDISDDGAQVVSADERDVVWGKCEGVTGLAPPSLSLLSLADGPSAPHLLHQVILLGDDKREPESVMFAQDNDLLAATLQDSHEVIWLRTSSLQQGKLPTSEQGTVRRLPPNRAGVDPWPDGITHFYDQQEREWFAVAGEANDAIYVLDLQGQVVAILEVGLADIPGAFPRDGTWGPLFRPDSLAAFRWKGETYLAASLKAAGAVGLWRVSDPFAAVLVSVVKVGREEKSPATKESSISPEGVAASSDFGFVLSANEGESSVSLILPEP
jgi:DNA-binding beta-propeller fold protein YncE